VILKNHSALTELKGAAKATSSSQRVFRSAVALGGEVSSRSIHCTEWTERRGEERRACMHGLCIVVGIVNVPNRI